MSRRPPAAADTAERNRAALKALVKLDSNKSCADCKRNKHPRWASWNLGVFVCIRCSGIHRSLGVHISRVKSVDLDSWTDEQLQSMVRWGNKRANRYWESKLAEGHVPNESKIENFIRTKYDSRRWVMEGPVPTDPSVLDDEGDDDVPLKVVQERARGNGVRNGSGTMGGGLPQAPRTRPQDVDLFGDPSGPVVARPSTTEPASRPGPPKAPAAPPKQTRPGESLLGLDFFGGSQSTPPARPSSTGPTTTGAPGRTDLKQSILSLYASKPAAPPSQSSMNAFGGMQSPPLSTASPPQSNAQALGGLGDAFGSLSFSPPPQQQPAKPAAFSGLTSPTSHTRQPSTTKSSLSGGSFFDMKPAPPPKQTFSPPQPTTSSRKESFGNDFGDFSAAVSPPAPSSFATKSPPAAVSSGMGDLFDLASPSAPAPQPPPKSVAAAPTAAYKSPPPISAANYSTSSAFNLSQPAPPAMPKAAPAPQASNTFSNLSNMDAWGSNDAWATPDPAPTARPQPVAASAPPLAQQSFATSTYSKPSAPAPGPAMQTPFDGGWGDPEPAPMSVPKAAATSSTGGGFGQSAGGFNVQQDEEFGGWSHASPVATTPGPRQGGGGGGGSDDLFGNVWE
ncbi:hypothetical protein LTR85_001132 [Meristemomyces frigidus]|nr:hypothetical protein LTR85_001132 [Meristemomyces frigidus]